jgi:hypothetical protein
MKPADSLIKLLEEYLTRGKSTMTLSRDPGDNSYEIFKNPTKDDFKSLGKVIRFTANNRTQEVYAWIFNKGHHADTSKAVGIPHRYNDPDMLMGAAEWTGSVWEFIESDFLKSFRGRMGAEDRKYLTALLSRDWSWADKYVLVTPKIKSIRQSLGL